MKLQTIVIIIGLIAIPIIGFGAYSAMSAPLPIGFPPPTFAGNIEIKHYPAYRSGTYTYTGPLSQAANAAFEPLYRHISSNNIPMTAPVETCYPIITSQEGQSGKTLIMKPIWSCSKLWVGFRILLRFITARLSTIE